MYVDFKLQSLALPVGWVVEWNNFYEFYPDYENPESEVWSYFKEDMLYLKNKYEPYSIDMGWIPEGNYQGHFKILVLKNENWKDPLYEFSSRNKDEIVDKLNELMADVSSGKIK